MPKTPKEMERILLKDGWTIKSQRGSHRKYVHPVKQGQVIVPMHTKELSRALEKKIMKDAGIEEGEK